MKKFKEITMNIQRYNSFNNIHKGLRAFLYETAIALQQADLASDKRGYAAVNRVTELLKMSDVHAHSEDTYFNEPLEKINPAIASIFEKEHEEDHRLGRVLTNLVDSWNEASSNDQRADIGRSLVYAFNEFIAFNLYHMNKEELQLNAVLWNTYTDKEIKATEQALIHHLSPDILLISGKWMMRGLNDNEIVKWMSETRAFAPAQVYELLCNIAKEELSESRLSSIHKRIEAEDLRAA